MLTRRPLNRHVIRARAAIACASLALLAAAWAMAGHSGRALSQSATSPSDARIKTDVQELGEDGLDMIDRMRLVRFRYDRDYLKAHPELDASERFGVIAQEYAGVFPRAVQETGERTSDGEAILGVDMQPALIHALGAIQQLHEKSREHESTLQQHEQRIADLMTQINDLDQEIDAKDALLRKITEELAERIKKLENVDKPDGPA